MIKKEKWDDKGTEIYCLSPVKKIEPALTTLSDGGVSLQDPGAEQKVRIGQLVYIVRRCYSYGAISSNR